MASESDNGNPPVRPIDIKGLKSLETVSATREQLQGLRDRLQSAQTARPAGEPAEVQARPPDLFVPDRTLLAQEQYLEMTTKVVGLRKAIKLFPDVQQIPEQPPNMPPGKPPSEAYTKVAGCACKAPSTPPVEMSKRPKLSAYSAVSPQVANRKSLTERPKGAPSILEEVQVPVKLVLSHSRAPGDILMLTAALRDLHKAYPGLFITDVRTPSPELFENNPYIHRLDDSDNEINWVAAEYPLVNKSNGGAYHFVHGFTQYLEGRLGLRIPVTEMKGDIHLSEQEKAWLSQVHEIAHKDIPYWIIDAGCKTDATTKQWEIAKYQAVVDALPEVTFAQIGKLQPDGALKHMHPVLKGANVINLLNKTTTRQLVRLMYHAAGVITPISFPMHLAAAVEMHPRYHRKNRPCIVIAGGREPAHWEAYDYHVFLHSIAALPCCDHGGCWVGRVMPLGDGDEKDAGQTCFRPMKTASGQIVPLCMDMIGVEEVVTAIRRYLQIYDYTGDTAGWNWRKHDMPAEVEEAKAKIKRPVSVGKPAQLQTGKSGETK